MNEVTTTTDKPKPDLVAGGDVQAIIPRNIDEVFRIAKTVFEARLYPDSYEFKDQDPQVAARKTAGRIVVGIMKGMEVGLPPINALSNIAIINGRPSVWGDAAKALVENSGKLEDFKEYFEGDENTDGWTAICFMKRVGQAEPIERRFSYGDAKRAGLLSKQPWKLYPQRMLQMRARSWAIRDGFADCLAGLQIREEVEDLPMKNITPVDPSFLDDSKPAQIEHTEGVPPAGPASDVSTDPAPDAPAAPDQIEGGEGADPAATIAEADTAPVAETPAPDPLPAEPDWDGRKTAILSIIEAIENYDAGMELGNMLADTLEPFREAGRDDDIDEIQAAYNKKLKAVRDQEGSDEA